MMNINPNKSKKMLFEIREQLEALSDILQEDESSSSLESEAEESAAEENVSIFLQLLSPDGRDDGSKCL